MSGDKVLHKINNIKLTSVAVNLRNKIDEKNFEPDDSTMDKIKKIMINTNSASNLKINLA